MPHATIIGTGSLLARRFPAPLEFSVHTAVAAALEDAGLASLDAVDSVVTVASDVLDGIMVATRSEVAGSYSRSYMHVPSGAGHAIGAAMALIESGAAKTLLLVGWGEGSKLAHDDNRWIQADPFYARPAGATPFALAALQAQSLIAAGHVDPAAAADYVRAMRERAGAVAASSQGAEALIPTWCDGVAALVLQAGEDGIGIRGVGNSFRPFCPDGDDLDPDRWVQEAIARADMRMDHTAIGVIEAGGPTPICELRATASLLRACAWAPHDARLNPSGGGAAASFGPATGLQRLVSAAAALRHVGPNSGEAVVLDLAGQLGQAVTAVHLIRGGRA